MFYLPLKSKIDRSMNSFMILSIKQVKTLEVIQITSHLTGTHCVAEAYTTGLLLVRECSWSNTYNFPKMYTLLAHNNAENSQIIIQLSEGNFLKVYRISFSNPKEAWKEGIVLRSTLGRVLHWTLSSRQTIMCLHT